MDDRANGYLVSMDNALWDVRAIHAALTESYWATGVPFEVVEKALEHSLGAGAYLEAGAGEPGRRLKQVGFARVVTDRATFAWVCDVYVVPEHQGRGLGKRMLAMLLAHPDLQSLRRWMLGTRDAHALYAQFGFEQLQVPGRFMQLHNRSGYGADRPAGVG